MNGNEDLREIFQLIDDLCLKEKVEYWREDEMWQTEDKLQDIISIILISLFHFSNDNCVHTSIVEIKPDSIFPIEWYVVHTNAIEDNHTYNTFIYTDQVKTPMP